MTTYRFTSSLFQIEPGEDDETNPRIYGRQLAAWLKEQLDQRGHRISSVVAEDWGRCLICADSEFLLWVGCGSSPDYGEARLGDPLPPQGSIVWSCMAEAEPSFWQRYVKRMNTAPALEKLNNALRDILVNEPKIHILSTE
jgi:hypothetical protein